MIDDSKLRLYVDEIFMIYDRDRNGTLDPTELANFFNEVFKKMNQTEYVSEREVESAIKNIDVNFDGKADKQQIFNVLKRMINASQTTQQPNPEFSNQQSSSYNSSLKESSQSPYSSEVRNANQRQSNWEYEPQKYNLNDINKNDYYENQQRLEQRQQTNVSNYPSEPSYNYRNESQSSYNQYGSTLPQDNTGRNNYDSSQHYPQPNTQSRDSNGYNYGNNNYGSNNSNNTNYDSINEQRPNPVVSESSCERCGHSSRENSVEKRRYSNEKPQLPNRDTFISNPVPNVQVPSMKNEWDIPQMRTSNSRERLGQNNYNQMNQPPTQPNIYASNQTIYQQPNVQQSRTSLPPRSNSRDNLNRNSRSTVNTGEYQYQTPSTSNSYENPRASQQMNSQPVSNINMSSSQYSQPIYGRTSDNSNYQQYDTTSRNSSQSSPYNQPPRMDNSSPSIPNTYTTPNSTSMNMDQSRKRMDDNEPASRASSNWDNQPPSLEHRNEMTPSQNYQPNPNSQPVSSASGSQWQDQRLSSANQLNNVQANTNWNTGMGNAGSSINMTHQPNTANMRQSSTSNTQNQPNTSELNMESTQYGSQPSQWQAQSSSQQYTQSTQPRQYNQSSSQYSQSAQYQQYPQQPRVSTNTTASSYGQPQTSNTTNNTNLQDKTNLDSSFHQQVKP